MDIIKFISSLQENNVDLSQLLNNIFSLFKQNESQPIQNNNTYYNMPNYDFNAKKRSFDSTMQGTMHSTMQCIVPPKTAISSQKTQNIDFNKIIQLLEHLTPLLSKLPAQKQPQKSQNIKPQNEFKSQILCLTKVPDSS